MADEEPTIVVFRVWRGKEGGVIALFPEVLQDCAGRYCSSFEHVGQHGGASLPVVLQRTRPAAEAEYRELQAELESEPYNYRLVVRRRITRSMRERMQAERRRTLSPTPSS